MFHKRYGHGCCHLKEKIYVFGGETDAFKPVSSAEMFDPSTYQWNVLASMTKPSIWLSVASCESKLYVWGIRPSGSTHDENVEIYDPKNDEWRIGAPIVEGRVGYKIFLVS